MNQDKISIYFGIVICQKNQDKKLYNFMLQKKGKCLKTIFLF